MTMWDSLLKEAKRCYRQPRVAARNILDMGVPGDALLPALGVVVAVSVILRTLVEISFGFEAQGTVISNAFMVGTAIVLHAACVWKLGEMMGGVGNFREALLIDIFLQLALLPVLLLFGFLFSGDSALSTFLALIAIVYATWVNLNFIDVLHKLESLWKSFGLILFAAFGSMILVGLLSIPMVLMFGRGNF